MPPQAKEIPTNFGLHEEQIQQRAMLESICEDTKDIKACLLGDRLSSKPGLVIEVDRLKQSQHTTSRVLWTVVTTFVGAIITGVYTFFFGTVP